MERIADSFDDIPTAVLDKFPGFDSVIYLKLKTLRSQLKASIKLKSMLINRVKSNKSNISIYDDDEDLSDFEVPKYITPPRKSNVSTNNIGTVKKPLKDDETKKSNKIELFSPLDSKSPVLRDVAEFSSTKVMKRTVNEMEDNVNMDNNIKEDDVKTPCSKKGKFVFKVPKRSSLDVSNDLTSSPIQEAYSSILNRIKSAANNLKPVITPEKTKPVISLDSSVPFQATNQDFEHMKSKFVNYPSTSTNPNNSYNNIDYTKNSTITSNNYYTNSGPSTSTGSNDNDITNIEIGDSIIDSDDENVFEVSSEPNSQCDVSFVNSSDRNKAIENSPKFDDDGWPVYRIEDFEDCSSKDVDRKAESQENAINASKKQDMGNFYSNVKNDGITGEFDGMDYPHSLELMEQFKEKFGLKSFRTNQLQVINATLTRHDCFVLMPTGGGKFYLITPLIL